MEDLFDNYQIRENERESNPLNSIGYLESPDGSQSFPFIGNLFFPHLVKDHDPHFFTDFFERAERYPRFLQEKSQRPFLDIYAAFQPFNEAFKALYPFLDLAQKILGPDAVILNMWDRNGWTTALLRSIFPKARIITTWEGNKDVLGYQGYHYWFGDDPQVNVLFCEVDQNLPLKDGCVDMVVGVDAFHRYDQSTLMNELDRICKDEASFIFPHVHLTNSEPQPYFDRGCIQKHGLEYQSTFDGIEKREGFVFSEPDLFKFQQGGDGQFSITSNPNTSDYNALIAILSDHWKSHGKLGRLSFDSNDLVDKGAMRVLINPLFKIRSSSGRSELKVESQEVAKLLERHPVYHDQLDHTINLSETQLMILLLADFGMTWKEMSQKIGIDLLGIEDECKKLESKGLIHYLPICMSFFRFQTFIGHQKMLNDKMDLSTMWSKFSSIYKDNTYLIDSHGNKLSYGDADQVITQVKKRIQAIDGVCPGDRIAILSSLNIENVLLFWAGASCGLTVIPLSRSLAWTSLRDIVQGNVRLLFVDQDEYENVSRFFDGQVIVFDSEEESLEGVTYFSDWIYDGANLELEEIEYSEGHSPVILYTSGSTGTPKGIELSNSNLVLSGYVMSRHFGWKSNDTFMAMGGLEYMSGLRNVTTCALSSGASIVIPDQNHLTNAFAMVNLIEEHRPSIIAGNPALLNLVSKVGSRDSLRSIRLLLCTGNYLPERLREVFHEKYNIAVHNYYGLTETCGICIAQDVQRTDALEHNIGVPVGCLARVVKRTSNGVGFLQIWSDNLAKGQAINEETKSIEWFDTGDLARIDNDGRVCLEGRAKEVIKTKGEQIIYLPYIEELLRSIPEIEEIVSHSVRENGYEQLVLFISVGSGIEAAGLKQNVFDVINDSLTSEKIPIVLYLMNELSYVNGKINKDKLLDEAIKNCKPL